MGQPIRIDTTALGRRIELPLSLPRPIACELIHRWIEEQARYRP